MSKKKKSRSGLRLNVVTSCISTTLVLVLLGAVVFCAVAEVGTDAHVLHSINCAGCHAPQA